jgi:hypothetical protein
MWTTLCTIILAMDLAPLFNNSKSITKEAGTLLLIPYFILRSFYVPQKVWYGFAEGAGSVQYSSFSGEASYGLERTSSSRSIAL